VLPRTCVGVGNPSSSVEVKVSIGARAPPVETILVTPLTTLVTPLTTLVTPPTTLVTGPATVVFASAFPGLKRVKVGTTTKRTVDPGEVVASVGRVEVRVEGGAGMMVV
jgi:hypothetical protein